MLTKIYFCLFCPQKFAENDESLKKHLIGKHFDAKEDPIVKQWVESLVNYQTELNLCLSSVPKSLPKSSMCQSVDNNSKQKLLKGCGLCDKIIDSFKLDINYVNKRKSVCICGGGKEVNKVVVQCIQCKHVYHYPCVEPTEYSGEEIALYKCLKCKPKDFKISDLSSESQLLQPIHVSHHFNYQPFVCKAVSRTVDGRTHVCNESFFRRNFLKTHLKSEHKLTPNERELSNYYELQSIPRVQHLIDLSLKKLCQNNTSNHLSDQTSAQSSSAQNHREIEEISDNLQKNKRRKTEANVQSVSSTDKRGSGEQSLHGFRNQNFNVEIGPPPHIEPVSIRYRNNTISTPPQLQPEISSSPPILVNQNNYNQIHESSGSQMPQMPKGNVTEKRGRGRPKGSKTKTGNNRSKRGQTGSSYARKTITPNCYIADGNPQLKSRLSEKSRLSRPNISLSREQERALHNNKNGNKKTIHAVRKGDDDSSDWDSDIEKYETLRPLDQRRVFESAISKNKRITGESSRNTVDENRQQIRASTSTAQPQGQPVNGNKNNQSHQNIESVSATIQEVWSASKFVSEPIQQMRSSDTEKTSDIQQTKPSDEVLLLNTDSEMSDTNNEPIVQSRPVLVTQITPVEDIQSMEIHTQNEMISSPQHIPQNEPVVNQSNSHSDWLIHTKPKKFPYFPQISDEVAYIPFGHSLYIKAVRDLGLYRQTNPTKYVGDEYINEILFAKVKEIKYEKYSNVRLTKLTLTLIEDKIETNRTFHVKFHDIDNILDFIILKQTYDNSLMRNWKVGDSFRAIIDDKWWFGEINSYNMTENNIKTHFQALNIVWGNGTTEKLSFWDLEPIIGLVPQNKNISIDVSDKDRHLFYMSEVQEWPVYGKNEESKRIVNGLNQVMQLKEYKEIIKIMNPSNIEYFNRVPYLINLSIVKSRVENMFYRRHAAVKHDIKYLESSAKIIERNGFEGVLKNAQIVIAVCLKFIDEHRADSIDHIYRKVMEDPNVLKTIKYYSCARPYLNPNPNIMNPLIASTCAQILYNNSDQPMTILVPSTTRPIINTIRRSNDSEISVVELSDDSDEDNEEVDGSQHRIQQMVNQMEEYVVSPTAPDSPLPPPIHSVETPLIPQMRLQTTRPVVPVRAQPIEERSQQQQSQDLFERYFCIFCNERKQKKTFSDRNQAIDHYCNELKIQLNCSQCPENIVFESLDHFLKHNSEHIQKMKLSFNPKTYLSTKAWIEQLVTYMDSLLNPITAQNEIDAKFGDCCIVCKCLNVLTPDSQPFFHKNVFSNNRVSMKTTVKSEIEFAQHMRKHLKYEPVYNCGPCYLNNKNNKNNVFTSATIDENCRQHLRTAHQIELLSGQFADITSFFGNTKIPVIDNLIPELVNLFIVNSAEW